ncbi:MAG: radical SAM protein [Candidatus Saganbacteria bacterium]|nr:radical SAM protein [Candidatus Saganbacteria bacterium]
MQIREVLAKSILTKTRIPDSDYALNPYIGCSHGCRYCYAEFIIRKFKGIKDKWGEYVDVKINAPELLAKEIAHKKKGVVLLSSICDPYQPIEKKYRLTRRCLEILLEYQFPVSILTKSSLVLRDVDLFKKFKNCEVGLSVATDNEKIKKLFEPNSSAINERIEALKKLHDEGIASYVFIGPILPQDPENLSKMLAGKVDYVLIDRMNYSYKVASIYKKNNLEYALESGYFEAVADTLKEVFKKNKIDVTVCF